MEIKELYEFKENQKEEHIPVITDDVLGLLRVLIKSNGVKNILEIGTATGVSAMFFSEFMGAGGKVTTIERDERLYFKALGNIESFGFKDKIDVVLADAAEHIKTLEGPYDMIFLDGAKSHYIHMLDDCVRLVRENGLIIGDNVTFRGMVTGENPALRRKITIIKRLRMFLEEIDSREELVSTVLNIGDGLSISVKI